jgi:phosphoserine phosphatase RsbU/P
MRASILNEISNFSSFPIDDLYKHNKRGNALKILIAEDEYTTRLMIQVCLEKWGYQVESVADGQAAWQLLDKPDAPEIALLDWEMPEIDGVELCRKIKELPRDNPIHVIMVTARDSHSDILQGFDAGADDYITKPFNDDELRARIRVGERIVRIQSTLSQTLLELRQALDLVDTLQGSIAICNVCQMIEDEDGVWHERDDYFSRKTDARFIWTQCPSCRK